MAVLELRYQSPSPSRPKPPAQPTHPPPNSRDSIPLCAPTQRQAGRQGSSQQPAYPPPGEKLPPTSNTPTPLPAAPPPPLSPLLQHRAAYNASFRAICIYMRALPCYLPPPARNFSTPAAAAAPRRVYTSGPRASSPILGRSLLHFVCALYLCASFGSGGENFPAPRSAPDRASPSPSAGIYSIAQRGQVFYTLSLGAGAHYRSSRY